MWNKVFENLGNLSYVQSSGDKILIFLFFILLQFFHTAYSLIKALYMNETVYCIYSKVSGPSCSKLTMTLVNVIIKYHGIYANIFAEKM